jgi:hypothetical protein
VHYLKNAQSKHCPNGRKIAQSGHPGVCRLFPGFRLKLIFFVQLFKKNHFSAQSQSSCRERRVRSTLSVEIFVAVFVLNFCEKKEVFCVLCQKTFFISPVDNSGLSSCKLSYKVT